MIIYFNLRHLEKKSLRLQGEASPEALDMQVDATVIQARHPLSYDIEIERLGNSILLRGRLAMSLQCTCVRCLKIFERRIELADWSCHLALEGEEAVPVTNDIVDLTPVVREDMLLSFPQHPLCEPGCGGLTWPPASGKEKTEKQGAGSVWTALDQLKLKKE